MSVTLRMRCERTWYRASAVAMGTVAELVVDGAPDHIATGFGRLRDLEAQWTRFDPASELNRLHRCAGEWTHIGEDLVRALVWSQRMVAETGGLFDPTVRRALEALGYDRSFRSGLDADDEPGTTSAAPGFDAVEVDPQRLRARIAPGATVDLGGIGKGLAADIVATELVRAGARAAYVSLGGDICACGEPPDDDGWPVPLLHPLTGEAFADHRLHEGGLVMSTTALRRWRRGAQVVHHIVDPRTGRPSDSGLLAVAVAAASAARAEALAKAALIAGPTAGAAMLRAAGVRAWLVADEAVMCVTAGDER